MVVASNDGGFMVPIGIIKYYKKKTFFGGFLEVFYGTKNHKTRARTNFKVVYMIVLMMVCGANDGCIDGFLWFLLKTVQSVLPPYD